MNDLGNEEALYLPCATVLLSSQESWSILAAWSVLKQHMVAGSIMTACLLLVYQ